MNPLEHEPRFPSAPTNPKLTRRLRFLLEADKLRKVERQTFLSDGSRRENSAEHSWHLALAIVLFSDAAHAAHVNLERALQIALVHDLVEIYAGDTFLYADAQAQTDRIASEQASATRLFGTLDDGDGEEFRALWEEYEQKTTPEARFVAAFDRLCPLLLNFAGQGLSWRAHEVSIRQVQEKVMPDLQIIPGLHEWAEQVLLEAVELGYLKP